MEKPALRMQMMQIQRHPIVFSLLSKKLRMSKQMQHPQQQALYLWNKNI
jgi:hypothetical protein